MATRKCKYCGASLAGRKFKVCLAEPCQARKAADEVIRKRNVERRKTAKEKAARLKKNPVFCENCGKPFTEKDNLNVPACHRPACQEWWVIERKVRIKARNKRTSDARTARDRAKRGIKAQVFKRDPPPEKEMFIPRADDLDQAKYIEKLKWNKALNGRTCMKDDCNNPCHGPYFFCDKHRADNFRIADSSRCEGLYGGGEDSPWQAYVGGKT